MDPVYTDTQIFALWPIMILAVLASAGALCSIWAGYWALRKLYFSWAGEKLRMLRRVMALFFLTSTIGFLHLLLMLDWVLGERWTNVIPYEILYGFKVYHLTQALSTILLHLIIVKLVMGYSKQNTINNEHFRGDSASNRIIHQ